MSNPEHEAVLRQGVAAWNAWRLANPSIVPFLRRVNLEGADLTGCDLHDAYLKNAKLRGAILKDAKLREANLEGAVLDGADLSDARLAGANLRASSLRKTTFKGTNLRSAILVGADLSGAVLENCDIYGVSAWDLNLEGCTMRDLIVTLPNQPVLTTDDLEIASLLFLILNNANVRRMLDSTTSKVVLLLGGFRDGGLTFLRSLATVLQQKGFAPIIFDFARPGGRNYTETILAIAGLSAFVVAEINGPSVPQEAHAVISSFSVPFLPLLTRGREGYALFADLREKSSVFEPIVIEENANLAEVVEGRVIKPAIAFLKEQARRREANDPPKK